MKSTLLTLLSSPSVPVAFRRHLSARLAAGRVTSGRVLAGEVLGWNAAIRAMGGTDVVPESSLPRVIRPHVRQTITFTPEGCEVRNEAQILHPHWRDAIQRGEQIPQDHGQLFAAGPVTERFIPREAWEALSGEAVVEDQPGGLQPLQHENNVIPVEGGAHAPDSIPPAPHPSNPFPNA